MRGRDLRVWQRLCLSVTAVVVVGACYALVLAVASTGAAPSHGPKAAAAARRPPVVLITFDGFPTVSLLNARRRIDRALYPAFASLAAGSTWFPNSTSSQDDTGHALRALFTGRLSRRFSKPTYRANPKNLFTLLGRRYKIVADEEVTSFCPKRLCPNSRELTAAEVEQKLHEDRPKGFLDWVARLSPSRRPTFYQKHVLLPHPPRTYLPSGLTYFNGPSENGMAREDWQRIPWLIQQDYQRHLLQVELADRLLGRALARLRSTGLYNRSLIVVTADHGESFGQPGNGREVDRRTVGDIAMTPLFVKLPFQRAGRINRRHVRIIDLAPTIARVVRLRPGWRVEGHSVFGRAARRIPRAALMIETSGERHRLSSKALGRLAAASLKRKLTLFGGSGDPFRLGPHRELHRTQVTRWPVLPAGALRAALDFPDRYRSVPPASPSPPVKVTGRLTGPGSTEPVDLAVAVNGAIEATASAFPKATGASRIFSVFIPETSLRIGANTVQVFAIQGGPTPALRLLGGT
jgi:hypothetical protein